MADKATIVTISAEKLHEEYNRINPQLGSVENFFEEFGAAFVVICDVCRPGDQGCLDINTDLRDKLDMLGHLSSWQPSGINLCFACIPSEKMDMLKEKYEIADVSTIEEAQREFSHHNAASKLKPTGIQQPENV
jgi:hypothetical protein